MEKCITYILLNLIIGLNLVCGQEIFKLNANQPSPLIITLPEVLDASLGDVVDLDTLFRVESELNYFRQWEFWDGSIMHVVENPVITLQANGIFYLTVIDENECTSVDAISLNLATTIGDKTQEAHHQQSIQVYPNPNSGAFSITISECQADYSILIYNTLGVHMLNKTLSCKGSMFRGDIILPARKSGIYLLLLKQNETIVYTSKIVVLNK